MLCRDAEPIDLQISDRRTGRYSKGRLVAKESTGGRGMSNSCDAGKIEINRNKLNRLLYVTRFVEQNNASWKKRTYA
jgi:hypothetical protein